MQTLQHVAAPFSHKCLKKRKEKKGIKHLVLLLASAETKDFEIERSLKAGGLSGGAMGGWGVDRSQFSGKLTSSQLQCEDIILPVYSPLAIFGSCRITGLKGICS